jgi:hypothetical protein
MTSLKSRVHAELDANTRRGMVTPWLTTGQLVKAIPQAAGRYETVARALRQLRFEGLVKSRLHGRYCQWTVTNGKTQPGQPVVPATPAPVSSTNPAASYKGSSRRLPMCIPTNMPTFVQATKDLVAEFVASERTFSAYDVTTTLRERANTGKVTIDAAETGTVYVGGNNVPKVEHETVKGIVHDLHHGGEMSGYARTHNGSYWQYAPSDDDDADDASSDDASSDDDGGIAVFAIAGSSDDDDKDDDKDDGYDGSPTL